MRCTLAALIVAALAAPALAQQTQLVPAIKRVDFQQTPAEQCFIWWAAVTGQHVVINWDRLEEAGYDRSYPVNMQLSNVRATTALRLLLAECFTNGDVIAEVRPQYTRIMTKQQANENPVVRVYSIGDLVVNVPNFDDAPEFDPQKIVGDSGGNSGGIFEAVGDDEPRITRADRVRQFMDAIRENVEPDIWHANGGRHASMSYLNGSLVVRAPEYVHKQIGLPAARPAPRPAVSPRRYGPSGGSAYRAPAGSYTRYRRYASGSDGVGGIERPALGNSRPWR